MKRKVLAVLLAASMMGTLGACGSSDSGKQTDAKTDDSSSTETTDSGEASADSSDGSFDGVKIETLKILSRVIRIRWIASTN